MCKWIKFSEVFWSEIQIVCMNNLVMRTMYPMGFMLIENKTLVAMVKSAILSLMLELRLCE